MSVSISGDGSVTGIDQGLNVVGVVTATTLNVGTGASISSPATNVLTLGTNNSERVRITSSGNVGIGTDNPYSNASFNTLSVGGSGKYGLIELVKSNGVAGSWIDSYGTSGDGNLRFTTAGTSGAITFWTGGEFTEKVRIDSSGRVTMPYQPSFFVYGNTDVAISSADTFVKTTLWGGVSHNTGSHWSSNRFTAPVAGKYLFGVNLRLDNVNSGYSRVIIGKNGSTNLNVNGHSIARYEVYGAGYYTHNVTILFNMAVDDYVEVYAYASSDASFISQSESQWWGYLVG